MAKLERFERFQQVVRPLIAQTSRPPAHVDVDIVDRRRTGRPETIPQHKTSPDRRSGDEPGFDYGLWIIRRKRGEIMGQCLDPLSLRCVDQGTCTAWQARATAPRCDQADHRKKAGASHLAACIRNRSAGVESVITIESRRRKRKASIPSAPPPTHTACVAPRAPGSSPAVARASVSAVSGLSSAEAVATPPASSLAVAQASLPAIPTSAAPRTAEILPFGRPSPHHAPPLPAGAGQSVKPPLAETPAAYIFQHTPPRHDTGHRFP